MLGDRSGVAPLPPQPGPSRRRGRMVHTGQAAPSPPRVVDQQCTLPLALSGNGWGFPEGAVGARDLLRRGRSGSG
eukprot:45115-Rhodomonas_salina.2